MSMGQGHFREAPPVGIRDSLRYLKRRLAVSVRLQDPLPHFCDAVSRYDCRCRRAFFIDSWYSEPLTADDFLAIVTFRFEEVFGRKEAMQRQESMCYAGCAWATEEGGTHFRLWLELLHPLPEGIRSPSDVFSLGSASKWTVDAIECGNEEKLARAMQDYERNERENSHVVFEKRPASV